MRLLIIISLLLVSVDAFSQPAEKMMLSTDKKWYYPGERVRFSVTTLNACTDSIAQLSSIAYIELVSSDAKSAIQQKIKITDAHGEGSLLITDNLTSGNYVLVAYTNWMKNFGQSIYARKPVHIVNPAKPGRFSVASSSTTPESSSVIKMNLETSKSAYSKRELVTIDFTTNPGSSVAVTAHKVNDIEKGDDEVYTSKAPDPCRAQPTKPSLYSMEKRGSIVMAKIVDKQSHLPATNVAAYLSVIDSHDNLYIASSDSGGIVRFVVGELEVRSELVLQLDPQAHNKYNIDIINPYMETGISGAPAGTDEILSKESPDIDDAIVSAQVQHVFNDNGRTIPQDSTGTQYRFYGKPDAFYLMSDYVSFSTVEEILREYVTSVGVQKRNGKLYPIINDVLSQKPFPDLPLIVVNGVPIFDTERFMSLNTDEFHSIAVVAHKYFSGGQMYYGVIDVRLNTSLKEFGPTAKVLDYPGTATNPGLPSPDYSDDSKRRNRKPDFRNVLYWNPRLQTDASGKGSLQFYTSDLEGEYVIVMHAVTRDGKLASVKKMISVK